MIRLHRHSLVIIVALLALISPLLITKQTKANAVSEWDAGRIIDDSIFYDSSAMSSKQIQAFLESKSTNCTDNCIRNYVINTPSVAADEYCKALSGGRKSAAVIIREATNACGMNPKAMLVLIQKEQGLITGNGTNYRYKFATGYCVYDTIPPPQCEGTDGFFNQIYYAARAFQQYAKNPESYNFAAGRTSKIQYSPDSSCGSSYVTILNKATAGLYNYTPYQPNKATVEAGWGEASCGAYGNRNFWLYFKAWFGTTEDTPFFKVSGDGKTYVLGENNNYYHVQDYETMKAYGYPYTISRVAAKSSNYLQGKIFSGKLTRLARFGSGENYLGVYLMDSGERHHFTTPQMITDTYGYDRAQEESHLPSYIAYYYPKTSNMKDVIKAQDKNEIYVMENGLRRRIVHNNGSPDIVAFRTGSPAYSTRQYVRLSYEYMNSLSASYPILGPHRLIKNYDTGSFSYWDGQKIYNVSRNTIYELGIIEDYKLHSKEIENLVRSERPITSLTKSKTSYLILDKKIKYEIPAAQITSYGLDDADFPVSPSSFVTRVHTKLMNKAIEVVGSKYLISSSGELDHFTSKKAVNESGYLYSDIITLTSRSASSFPLSGKKILETGTVFKIAGSPHKYIINSSGSKLYIDTNTKLNEYGFHTIPVYTFSESETALYPTVGNFGIFSKDSSDNIWLTHSNGLRQFISPELASMERFNLNLSSLPKLSTNIYRSTTNIGALKNLQKNKASGKVYYIENGVRKWVRSQAAIKSLGYTSNDITEVSESFILLFPSGSDIN